ncbi:aminodeoxychorismate synthase component I [Rodentibacter pneumotropicus]|uniref:aminodeoxychorismate synthase component I n=1 Tax=Rodentibacter pneumotropicus TaxID=758 RepID=UPI0009892310|nr:aminodeoxychorismate synthase component I [Rodentibacter pneumotropicus]NBH75680.1 aminodeoxychorismate synthase component I [Rodentibacter pneumotropicus]OOF60946.1 aminodeoxychorismate synthase component I [Rodentibacter pneumotropicus]THA06299.1 aminodeoxychorismate synthase component I [Rodentibacter pneumotropicus]THA12736.1 aminodeoxychorismate synthase component I [Rodentibacter pneumotropicus]
MQHFIRQANRYGAQSLPFFFLIDFEQQKPLIFPLEEASKQGIYFDIQGKTNYIGQAYQAISIEKYPVSFTQYRQSFELVQQQLQQGNSYLLNLTYPTEITGNIDFESLFYQAVAPYKLWLKNQFVCFSPECFINIQDNKIFTYPMKGTINATLPDAENQLLNDEKEQREHYTIVDLMRNDLAMVASNIQVTKFRYVDRIATQKGEILQTSSEICGELDEKWQENIGNLLATLLPAGSISGAPKEKTVQIIQQAEHQPRGYYTGIFGLFDGKNLQSAVAIRFISQVGEKYYFHSGGGITIQSRLEDEYQELLEKVYLPSFYRTEEKN